MKAGRALWLIVVLIVVAGGSWWFLSHRGTGSAIGDTLDVYYTKATDGTSEVSWPVSMRPMESGETSVEHTHNAALYAAVQSIAGPPADVQAVRFPTGTRVLAVTVAGTTATVNLSGDVKNQAGGTFGENGEFKSLVYTLTAVPGIDAVSVLVDGQKLDTLPGGHLELDQPLHRADF
jgi:N-acetylmuramoyl-L-alanine amidase